MQTPGVPVSLTPTPGLLEAVPSAGAVQAGSQPTAGAALTTPAAGHTGWSGKWPGGLTPRDTRTLGNSQWACVSGCGPLGTPVSDVTHVRLEKTSPNPAEQVCPFGEQAVESPAGGTVPPVRGGWSARRWSCAASSCAASSKGRRLGGGGEAAHTEAARLRNAQRRGGKGPGFSQPTWSTTGSLVGGPRQAQPYNRLDSSRGQ